MVKRGHHQRRERTNQAEPTRASGRRELGPRRRGSAAVVAFADRAWREHMAADLDVLNELLERIRLGHMAWINGDCGPYEFSDERSTIMGAFGGSTVGATLATPGQQRAVAQFESGSGSVDLVNGGVSGDAAWLVVIEHAMVTFTGRSSPVRWDLRATEVFERRGGEWVRVHRHADPLVDRHSLDEILTLLP